MHYVLPEPGTVRST